MLNIEYFKRGRVINVVIIFEHSNKMQFID